MLFRGREPEASIWRRFAPSVEAFTVSDEGGLTIIRASATAERLLDHLRALVEELPPFVDVAIDDLRTGRSWAAEARPRRDVSEVILTNSGTFARYGGVELSVYTRGDQLTLTPHLELYIYARTDRWVYLLQGRGLEERLALPQPLLAHR